MEVPVSAEGPSFRDQLFSTLDGPARDEALRGVRALTGALYEGLDVSCEIEHLVSERIGDTILVDDAGGIGGVAVCHVGGGSEAGS